MQAGPVLPSMTLVSRRVTCIHPGRAAVRYPLLSCSSYAFLRRNYSCQGPDARKESREEDERVHGGGWQPSSSTNPVEV